MAVALLLLLLVVHLLLLPPGGLRLLLPRRAWLGRGAAARLDGGATFLELLLVILIVASPWRRCALLVTLLLERGHLHPGGHRRRRVSVPMGSFPVAQVLAQVHALGEDLNRAAHEHHLCGTMAQSNCRRAGCGGAVDNLKS